VDNAPENILKKLRGEDVTMATTIKRPISTEMKTTPKKAPMHAIKSNLSIFQ